MYNFFFLFQIIIILQFFDIRLLKYTDLNEYKMMLLRYLYNYQSDKYCIYFAIFSLRCTNNVINLICYIFIWCNFYFDVPSVLNFYYHLYVKFWKRKEINNTLKNVFVKDCESWRVLCLHVCVLTHTSKDTHSHEHAYT